MKAIVIWALRRMDKKDWREAVLASLPDNGKKEERIKELVSFGLGRHVHRNPPKGRKRIAAPDPHDYEDPTEFQHDLQKYQDMREAREDERKERDW